MFDINTTITRKNGIRPLGTLLPHLPYNTVYEVYQGLDRIRHGTLYLFLNRYDPAGTMRNIYGFDEELTNLIISKLTLIEDKGDEQEHSQFDDFCGTPFKAGQRYDYTGYGIYAKCFQGTIVPIMYHWYSSTKDNMIIERFVRISEDIVNNTQHSSNRVTYAILDDVVINNQSISSTIDVSFEGQSRYDKTFTYPANTVSILSPTPRAKSFNGLVSRFVDGDDLGFVKDADRRERIEAYNAHDFYKHYVA